MRQGLRPLFRFSLWSVLVLAGIDSSARADEVRADHVRVEYDGIDETHAKSIAKTISAARRAYVEALKFPMPETILVKVDCGPKQPSRLFTDGKDRVFLSLPSSERLAPPKRSGTFILYGLCHELGHIAMYRILEDRDWMTTGAAEGWAHYAGSVVVDAVFENEGKDLWPTPYDYRADGTARLREQLSSPNASDIAIGARQWQKLADILGETRFPKLFSAWQAAKIDPLEPNSGLLNTAVELAPEHRAKIENWWKNTEAIFVEVRQKSDVKVQTAKLAALTGKPIPLAPDDGMSDGKRSIAGGGHARLFEAPGPEFYLTSVSFFGARYGAPKAPEQKFDIALCDKDLRPIAIWKKPYADAKRGDMAWIKAAIPPTRVPAKFYLCLVFNPTATKGVFVGSDSSTKGHSQTATPGKPGKALADGDWMIRVELDQLKTADAISTDKPESR